MNPLLDLFSRPSWRAVQELREHDQKMHKRRLRRMGRQRKVNTDQNQRIALLEGQADDLKMLIAQLVKLLSEGGLLSPEQIGQLVASVEGNGDGDGSV